MEFNNPQQVMLEALTKELESLKDSWKVEGVRTIEQIKRDLDTAMFSGEMTVINNKRFELVFNTTEMEIQFFTTYSNQRIDEKYMNEMMVINQSQGRIGGIIKGIFDFSSIEA